MGKTIEFWDSGTCPYAQRAWLALLEKKLPFDTKIVDLRNKPQDFKDLYATINPDPDAPAKVPIIIDTDGSKVIESNIVVEYLDDKYPDSGEKLLPASAAEKAKVKLFVEAFGEKFTPFVFKLLKADTKAAIEEGKTAFEHNLEILDKYLQIHGTDAGGDYFLGSKYSMADLSATPFLKRALVVLPSYRQIDVNAILKVKGLGRMEKWIKACIDRPAHLKTTPDDETILASLKRFVSDVS